MNSCSLDRIFIFGIIMNSFKATKSPQGALTAPSRYTDASTVHSFLSTTRQPPSPPSFLSFLPSTSSLTSPAEALSSFPTPSSSSSRNNLPSEPSHIYISSDNNDSDPEIVVTGSRKLTRAARIIHRSRTAFIHAMAPASASSGSSAPRRQSARVKAQPKPPPPAPVPTPEKAKPQPANSRSLRPQRQTTGGYYELSSDESGGDDQDGSGYSQHGEDSDDDEEATQEPVEQPERGSAAGKSLRPRKLLAAPAGLEDYVDTNAALSKRKRSTKKKKAQTKKKGRLGPGRACKSCRDTRRRCDRAKPRCGECVKANRACIVPDAAAEGEEDEWEDEDVEATKQDSIRTEIRRTLEETKRKRDAFYVHYRELFEPLLPEKNYISKLAEKRVPVAAAPKDADVVMVDGPSELSKPEEVNGNGEEKHDAEAAKPNNFELEVRNGPTDAQLETVTEPVKYPEVIPYQLLEKQPENVKATMKSYQLSGLSYLVWLYKNGISGILGDEMGLGKTLQTLSLFSYLTTYEPTPPGHQRPFLVVCPLSVLSSWMAECKRWTPHLRALRFHGPTAERARLKKVAETGELLGIDDSEGEGRGYDVVVTSYEVFEREKAWFRRAFVWRYVVLDEGHKIKNEKTNISMSLQGLAAEYRLILTGTPLQNNLTELWALLHWLYPDVFVENTSKLFSDAFDLTLGKNDLNVMDNARKLLELVMLRRMKESQGVNLGLPKKTELIMFLPLTPMQRFWYKRLLTRLDKGLLEGVFQNSKEKAEGDVKEEGLETEHIVKDEELGALDELGGDEWGVTKKIVEQAVEESSSADGKWRKLMNLLMQLRKCCDHPYLLPNAEPEGIDHSTAIMLASSKMIFLDKLIEELCMNQGKKVLIFSGFTKMMDLCEDFLHMKGGDGTRFKYGRLDGTTPRARRNLAIRLFNNDPSYKVMLISTRAGGLGINLASASDVVMLESDWNPQADLQAQARAHRIGQKNPVTIYRLITQGTVEEQMMGRIRKKLYLSAKVTESMRDIHTKTSSIGLGGDTEENAPTLSTGQLMALVRSGSRAIARPEIDPTEMLKWDWETTIQKCRDYQEKLENETKEGAAEAQEEERRWLSEMERVETRVFEGKRHEKSDGDTNRDIAKEWTREARRMGMERVVMVDGHPVLKETIGNNEWEAVKTFAGTDPRLAEPPKRKKRAIEHQDYCQVCFDGGVVVTCSGCPRTYHAKCLPEGFEQRLKGKAGNFYCPQHECVVCEQKTVNAGGLIFRCRWCENGYCEDCMDWDSIQLLGENLPEFELLNFGPIEQAFWIKCEHCVHRHQHDLEAKALCDTMEKEWLDALAKRPELVMEGTTVEGSEVATPIDVEELVDSPMISPFEPAQEGKKRRRKQVDYTPKRNAKKQKVKAEAKAEIAGLLTAPPQESTSPLPPQEPLVNA